MLPPQENILNNIYAKACLIIIDLTKLNQYLFIFDYTNK